MSNNEETSSGKWDKPKILLMDFPESLSNSLSSSGYNVSVGSFGKLYQVVPDGRYSPLRVNGDLTNYHEQEVIFLDTEPPEKLDSRVDKSTVPDGQRTWFVRTTTQFVDPRPRMMEYTKEAIDKILDFGGVIVVFSGPRCGNEYVFAIPRGGSVRDITEVDSDNWSFCSVLERDRLAVSEVSGDELSVVDAPNPISEFLRRHLQHMRYEATLAPTYYLSPNVGKYAFYSLLETKFGDSAGGVIVSSESKGMILLLPRIKSDHLETFIGDLVSTLLPEVSPHLFPYHEGAKWLLDPEYEHLRVIELESSKQSILKKASEQVRLLDEQIAAVRSGESFIHGILTKASEPLVVDVKFALERLGFSQVVNVDELEEDGAKQEDLQIHDRSPLLLAEVKGLSGFPTEGDTTQVVKYVMRRMKELQRHDISAVVIVNHQRSLPPIDRNHESVFTSQQVEDAEHNEMLLVTTWEIFQLLRGKEIWGWPSESLTELFYGKGRIRPIPTCYKRIGEVGHFYDRAGVVSIKLDDDAELRIGETIGYRLQNGYFQEDVNSMQVNKTEVEVATAGQSVGIETVLERRQLPDGTVAYAVRF